MKRLLILVLSILSLTIFAQDCQQLARQITTEVDAVDATLPQINIFIKKGEKAQARTMIEKTLRQIETIEANYQRLAQMNDAENADVPSLAQLQETKRYLTNKANLLRYTCIYLQCDAQLTDGEYTALKDDILTSLSDENVSFVDNVGMGDWTVTITAKVNECKKADFDAYFSYISAKTVMKKASNGKRVLDKTLTEKGGSPFGFEQAAQEAYKAIAPKISAIIKEQIQQ